MNKMNKIISTVIILLGLFSSEVQSSANCSRDPDPEDILIVEGGSTGGVPIYHAPALIPIQAAYDSFHSTIMVLFQYDLGSVSVEIENQTTSEYSQTLVNATQGVHPFVISGHAGIYEITFTLSNGQVYQGSFEIE